MTPSHQFPISVKDHPEIRSDDLSYTNSEPVREEIEDNVVHDFHLVNGTALIPMKKTSLNTTTSS
jgi:hypothetical protein